MHFSQVSANEILLVCKLSILDGLPAWQHGIPLCVCLQLYFWGCILAPLWSLFITVIWLLAYQCSASAYSVEEIEYLLKNLPAHLEKS